MMKSATPSPTGTASPSPGRTAGGLPPSLMVMTLFPIPTTQMASEPAKP